MRGTASISEWQWPRIITHQHMCGCPGAADHFKCVRPPNVLITTCYKPSGLMYKFISEMLEVRAVCFVCCACHVWYTGMWLPAKLQRLGGGPG